MRSFSSRDNKGDDISFSYITELSLGFCTTCFLLSGWNTKVEGLGHEWLMCLQS